MKTIKFLILVFVCCLSIGSKAQTNYFQLSPRVGWDVWQKYNNNASTIKYGGGLHAGISADYYWGSFGIGADFDYIKNKAKSNFNTTNLLNAFGVPLTSFTETNTGITRMFYGLGPSYKFSNASSPWVIELNGRVGLSSIQGGRVQLNETTTLLNELLTMHGGYNTTSSLAFKLQARANYFINSSLGFHVGAYYMNHLQAKEKIDPLYGLSYYYLPTASAGGIPNIIVPAPQSRVQPCNCDVQSIGVFAGLSLKIKGRSGTKPIVKGKEYTLIVTAKDKYTGEKIPNTEVLVKNSAGEVVRTGITNSEGKVVFDKIAPDDYVISGTIAEVALEGNTATKDEFLKQGIVRKDILYTDRGFLIKGKIFECNSTTIVPGVQVVLENKAEAFKKTTITDATGAFLLKVNESGVYNLYGKKDSYLSQIEEVNAGNYNRDKNLFIKLEICAEKADCGKAIKLNNILYDLDKYVLKEVAKRELDKLIQFMQDNPGIRVELGSHTDSRASDSYNQTLSQNRAQAAVDYIVSKGIERSRITAKGYGESKLLNKCADGIKCTEAEHSINRRTEMKVLCPED
jgi:outer membrane protein OmpA-like peptidoglycan-associated protein